MFDYVYTAFAFSAKVGVPAIVIFTNWLSDFDVDLPSWQRWLGLSLCMISGGIVCLVKYHMG